MHVLCTHVTSSIDRVNVPQTTERFSYRLDFNVLFTTLGKRASKTQLLTKKYKKSGWALATHGPDDNYNYRRFAAKNAMLWYLEADSYSGISRKSSTHRLRI